MKCLARRRVWNLTRWDPYDEIRKTQENLTQLFEEYVPMKEWKGRKVFMPPVDIKEEGDNLVVTTDLPGINKEDIKLDLKNNVLEISATREEEKETEKEGYIRRERSYTRFYRAVCLPTSVKEEGTAKMENGVLTIILPKMKPEEPKKKIKIE
jgi:HSP20 family protein